MLRTCQRPVAIVKKSSLCIVLGLAAGFANSGHGQQVHPFTEEAVVRGLGDFTIKMYELTGGNSGGYGVAFGDLTNDGHPDLIAVGSIDDRIGLWQNDGKGYFTNREPGSNLPKMPKASAIALGDYNANGFLDLVVTQLYEPTYLLENLGDFTFENVTAQAGINESWRAEDATFGDVDGDGWLDLYIVNHCNPAIQCVDGSNRLYRNNGDGTFTEVASELGLDDKGFGFHAAFFDFDRNGWQDLYLSNDRGHLFLELHNRLYRNHGGWFEDVSVVSGTNFAAWSMGIGIGDFSHTGWEDIYVTNVGTSGYFVHSGDFSFHFATVEAGLSNMAVGWAAPMFDFDNDGLIDIYIANSVGGANRLYRNVGAFPAVDVAIEFGVSISNLPYSHCVALADINQNGALDMVVSRMNHPQTQVPDAARLYLFVNHEGSQRNWLKLNVAGRHPNLFAVGALIDIRTGDTWQYRQISGGNDYKGENHKVVHFGLGEATLVDKVIVRWPSGEIRVLEDVAANQLLSIEPPEPGDLNGDGEIGPDDLKLLLAAWGPCEFPAKCPADLSGSGAVGIADLLILLNKWGP